MWNDKVKKMKIGAIVVAMITFMTLGTAMANTNNNPPNPPEIEGPTSGKIWNIYVYNITITDPDGDSMQQLEVDFGDGMITLYECGCTEPFWESGDTLEVFHSWKKSGDYVIKARVMDIHGAWSDWGSLKVSMPKSYSPNAFWERVIQLLGHIFGRDILPDIF